ncbi:MAG TPA: hypothetical protein VIL88_00965 [Devosia sp.]|jgi:hypothetical protein|uniref:hypothetical protein n=1 Tax=Devosia sp. TaxID=1871048 RepID=UPI002F91DC6F
MHIKTLVSASTLAIVLGFSGTAFAQTSIGGQTLSEGDMERVKVYCEDLQNEANQAAGASSDESELNSTDDDSSADAAATGTATGSDEEDDDTADVGTIDMDLITLENCSEAGFITPTAQ